MLSVHIATLVTATAVFIASGCGGSSTTGTTSNTSTFSKHAAAQTTRSTAATQPKAALIAIPLGTPLTRSEWIKKGEAVCSKLNAQLAANTAKSTSEFARILPQAAAYEHTELVTLAKLIPPASMALDWRQFLTETKEWSENSLKIAQATPPGQFKIDTPLAVATKNIHEHLAAIARRDGFKECALV